MAASLGDTMREMMDDLGRSPPWHHDISLTIPVKRTRGSISREGKGMQMSGEKMLSIPVAMDLIIDGWKRGDMERRIRDKEEKRRYVWRGTF